MAAIVWRTQFSEELAKWQNSRHYSADLIAHGPDSDDRNRIAYQTQAVSDGSIHIARSSGRCSVSIHRSARHIRQKREKVCTLFFPIRQKMRFTQEGKSGAVGSDQFFMLHSESPSTLVSAGRENDPWEGLFVTVPETLLLEAHVSPRDYGGIAFKSGGDFGGVAFSVFDELLRMAPSLPQSELIRLVKASLQIVSVAMRQSGQGRQHTEMKEEHLARLLAAIEARLGEQGLTSQMVADRCGISRRYLHLIFKNKGTTFAAYLWDERLNRAAAALADPNMAHHSIEQIANYFGFKNTSHFARLYSARFGQKPSEARRAS